MQYTVFNDGTIRASKQFPPPLQRLLSREGSRERSDSWSSTKKPTRINVIEETQQIGKNWEEENLIQPVGGKGVRKDPEDAAGERRSGGAGGVDGGGSPQTVLRITSFSNWKIVHFSSVAQSCPSICDPMNCSTPGLPVHHQLPESTQTPIHQLNDAIEPSHLMPSTSPPAFNLSQHHGLFKWVSSSIR